MQTVIPLVNLYFDPARQGYDVSTWATLSGTPTINGSNLLEVNAATIIGTSDISRGELTMTVNVPFAPASGDVKEWGLYQLNNSAAATFRITGAVLTAYVCDADGNTQSTTITQVSSWFGAATKYTIAYGSGAAKFLINGQQVAIFQGVGVPSGPLSIYVKNSDADAMTVNHYQLLMADMYSSTVDTDGFGSTGSSGSGSSASTTSYTHYQNDSFTTANVKASSGHVYSLSVTNTTATTRYIQLHNSPAAASSGDSAEYKAMVGPYSQIGIGTDIFGPNGKLLTSGITVANSTAASTFTAGSAGDLLLDLYYDGGTTTLFMLLETGDMLLLETGDMALLES